MPAHLPCRIVLFCVIGLAGVGAPGAARVHAFQASSLPTVDPLTAQTIQDLKRKALGLSADPQQQHDIYQQILKLNPDDAVAREELDKLNVVLKKETDDRDLRLLQERDRQAEARLLDSLLADARQGVIEAKSTGSSAPLVRAELKLAEARKHATTAPAQDQVAAVASLVDAERSAQRMRAYELWGGVGLIVALAVVGLVAYFWRRPRALEMLDGPEPGRQFVLHGESTSVGALPDAVDWCIVDVERKVSRHHCDVVRRGRHYFLVDRSTNGTMLNGQRLRNGEPQRLRSGDRIGLGGAVTLLFR